MPGEEPAEVRSVEKSKVGSHLLHAHAGVAQAAPGFQHEPALQQLQRRGVGQALAHRVEVPGREPHLRGIAGNGPMRAVVRIDQGLEAAQMPQAWVRMRSSDCVVVGFF